MDARRIDKEYAIYSAVCAYIAHSNGEIILKESSGDEINPAAIGIGVAAGVKQSELTRQYLCGEIEESRFIKFLKIAACVAAFALVIYLAIHFAGPVVGEIFQYLALDPSIGFWWGLLDVAMITMFLASLSLGVLLQGAFIAFLLCLVIEVVDDWIASKREAADYSPTVATTQGATSNQAPSEAIKPEANLGTTQSKGYDSPTIEI